MGSDSKIASDVEALYKWFKNSCDSQDSSVSILDINEVGEFFTDKMKAKEMDPSTLSIDGFDCIQSYFLLSNEKENKLQRQTKASSSSMSYDSYMSALGPYGSYFYGMSPYDRMSMDKKNKKNEN